MVWFLKLFLVDDLVTDEVAVFGRGGENLWRSVLAVGVIADVPQLGGHRQALTTE